MKKFLLIISMLSLLGVSLYTIDTTIDSRQEDIKNKEIPLERYVEIRQVKKEIEKVLPIYMSKSDKKILEVINNSMVDDKITFGEDVEINILLQEREKTKNKLKIEKIKNDLKSND